MRPNIAITVCVIVNSLFPKERNRALPRSFTGTPSPGYFPVPREDIPDCLAGLDRAVGTDGKLALFFPGCASPAAPFLLFRLKREGYSSCRAISTGDGLLVDARR
ncbi:MAG TPA: hypothetical protein VK187_15180 [Geobacteraceae bacterium]|nr:hypothetical protein [Geobacteraceae bacterium]